MTGGERRQPKLSVIAVTHESSHVLPKWLDALETSGHRDDLELCIVDSGSSPHDLATVRKMADGRADAFVALPNVGYGMACNAGAAATSAPTLLLSNPDVRVLTLPARALGPCGLGDTMLGGFAVGPPRRSLGFARLPTWKEEAQELTLGPWSRAYARSVEPEWVSGAALMIGREAFERIGGFSPAFFMYFEDADLCARHRLAGGAIELDPDLLVGHQSGESTAESRRAVIGAALESVNRLSGRRFAARYGRPWHAPALYLLLALAYAPRRALLDLTRRRLPLAQIPEYTACLLSPRIALRSLNVQIQDISPDRP